MICKTFLSTQSYDMSGLQMVGHLINGKGKKVAGPTISGSFDGVLTAHMEDGSERKLWEKNWGPHGRDSRCLTCVSPWTKPRNQGWPLIINRYPSLQMKIWGSTSGLYAPERQVRWAHLSWGSPVLTRLPKGFAEHLSSSHFGQIWRAGHLWLSLFPARARLPGTCFLM